MEVSAIKLSGGTGLHRHAPFLRLQSDERLVALVRRGNPAAFELLVGRYRTRLLAFCRHMLGSHEDAEDVLQEVFAAAYNAILGDDRPINLRPWLYRIARNRCLNHIRKAQAVGVDSMDIHLSNFGATTADQVFEREDFRELVSDIAQLPETQRTALVLREMDALSYEQISEAMDTTISSVKSLLVRARVSLAEAAEARMLTCEEVRAELGAVAEGLIRKPTPPVRRHLKACARCDAFQSQLKQTSKALAAIMPIGPLMVLRQFAFTHLSHSAGSGATAAGSGAGAGTSAAGTTMAGATVAAGTSVAVGSGASGLVSAGMGALATKAFAGLAAAALVTAGAVAVDHVAHVKRVPDVAAVVQHVAGAVAQPLDSGVAQASLGTAVMAGPITPLPHSRMHAAAAAKLKTAAAKKAARGALLGVATGTASTLAAGTTTQTKTAKAAPPTTSTTTTPPGRVDTTPIPTVLPAGATTTPTTTTTPADTTPTTTTTPASTTTTTTTTPATTTTTPATTTTTPATTTTTPASTTPGPTTTTPTGTTPAGATPDTGETPTDITTDATTDTTTTLVSSGS